MKIFTSDKETGNKIEQFATIEEAVEAIKAYEEADKAEGNYTEGFYDIINEECESYEYMDVSSVDYAKLHGITEGRVRQKILAGNLRARKIGNSWIIKAAEPWIDNRKHRE